MIVTVLPNSYTWYGYRLPKAGPLRFRLAATLPIKTYVLTGYDLSQFSEGKPFAYAGGYPQPLQLQEQQIYLEAGTWYLLIANPNLASASVSFDVFF